MNPLARRIVIALLALYCSGGAAETAIGQGPVRIGIAPFEALVSEDKLGLGRILQGLTTSRIAEITRKRAVVEQRDDLKNLVFAVREALDQENDTATAAARLTEEEIDIIISGVLSNISAEELLVGPFILINRGRAIHSIELPSEIINVNTATNAVRSALDFAESLGSLAISQLVDQQILTADYVNVKIGCFSASDGDPNAAAFSDFVMERMIATLESDDFPLLRFDDRQVGCAWISNSRGSLEFGRGYRVGRSRSACGQPVAHKDCC